MNKKLGVLLSVSSLPSSHGIGDFGDACFEFIDWLKKNKYKYWQVLPLNSLGPGYSPYMSTCTNAIEYRYISLDYLTKQKLISKVPEFNSHSEKIDFYRVGEYKKKYLYRAYEKFMKLHPETLHKFKFREPWVIKYATFEVFKWHNDNKQWNEWKDEDRDYYLRHCRAPKSLLNEIDFVIFLQYMALKQWKRVLRYANKNGVDIICDMPFYVGFDGVECWLNRDQFSIGSDNKPFEVGGVGPDAFSDIGQLWGAPIYNFNKMKANNYKLLIDRIGYLSKLCNYLRIDHFRAFDTYYVIPASDKDARNGKWRIGPRDDFFKKMYAKYPNIKLIVEDLGDLRPEAIELRDQFNLPGMFVSEFAIFNLKNFSTDRQIVYPGTHDNETLYGWYLNRTEEEIEFIKKRLNVHDEKLLYDAIVKYIFTIPSLMTIFPMQDLLKLDNSARMNFPGTVGSPNWEWKLKDDSYKKKVLYPDYSWFE